MPLSGVPHLPCIRMTPVADGCAHAAAGNRARTTSSARKIFISASCSSGPFDRLRAGRALALSEAEGSRALVGTSEGRGGYSAIDARGPEEHDYSAAFAV